MTQREWDAASYHRLSDPQFAWGMRVLERVTLSGDERALDAGCGSGRITVQLAQRLPRGQVIGVDMSENMVRAAVAIRGPNEIGTPRRGAQVHAVCADLLALPFRTAFQLVFSTATFHWVLDHRRLFAGLFDVLEPGGRLEAQCGGGPNLEHVHTRATALASRPPFQSHFATWTSPWEFATPPTTERRLLAAGFSHARCWLEEAPVRFEDAATYREFLKTVVMRPYLERLPEGLLREEFLDWLTAAARDDEPPFSLDYWRLNISAARA